MDGQSSSAARGLPPTGPRGAGPRAADDDEEVAENVVCVNRRDALLEGPDAVSYTHLTLPTKRIV